MVDIMDDEELNIFCEYVLMPRLEALQAKAAEEGIDAYLSVDSRGLPALAVNSGDNKFIISCEPLDVDWEALMDLERDSCIMLIRATLRLASRKMEKNVGMLVFPEEDMPSFKTLTDILGSGVWMRENALSSEYKGEDVLPKLYGLLSILDEADLEHTEVFYPEDGSPFILVESDGYAYEFSWIHFNEDTYLLRIAYRENEQYADAMIFPEGDEMGTADHYDKLLGIFERYSLQ